MGLNLCNAGPPSEERDLQYLRGNPEKSGFAYLATDASFTLYSSLAFASADLPNSIAMGVDIETMKDGDNATFPAKGQKVTFFIHCNSFILHLCCILY